MSIDATSDSRTPSLSNGRTTRAIVAAGLAAGVLDILAACTAAGLQGGSPGRVLQSVAGGWLGRAAFEGGAKTMALGLFSHFLIAFLWATLFVLLSRRFKVLLDQPWISGPLYGLLVYAVMYRVVIPLSALDATPPVRLQAIAIHVLFVGLPIALAARWASRGRRRAPAA